MQNSDKRICRATHLSYLLEYAKKVSSPSPELSDVQTTPKMETASCSATATKTNPAAAKRQHRKTRTLLIIQRLNTEMRINGLAATALVRCGALVARDNLLDVEGQEGSGELDKEGR